MLCNKKLIIMHALRHRRKGCSQDMRILLALFSPQSNACQGLSRSKVRYCNFRPTSQRQFFLEARIWNTTALERFEDE